MAFNKIHMFYWYVLVALKLNIKYYTQTFKVICEQYNQTDGNQTKNSGCLDS